MSADDPKDDLLKIYARLTGATESGPVSSDSVFMVEAALGMLEDAGAIEPEDAAHWRAELERIAPPEP